MKEKKNLIITQGENGEIICQKEGDTGMCIQGVGVSVLEAIGSWYLYSGIRKVICEPPSLKETRFQLEFKPIPKR